MWRVLISEKKNGQWQKGKELQALRESAKLRLAGSYSLNKDASKILYTSKKRGGIGGFDVWLTKKSSSGWSEPENLGKPLNSSDDEINPFFSSDENTVYFIRRTSGNENGDLYASQKSGSYWKTPKKIELGSQQFYSAKIAADDKTMYLTASDGSKTSLFISRLENGDWSTPTQITDYPDNAGKNFGLSSSNTNLIISNKESEEGTFDLQYIQLETADRSIPVTTLKLDLKTKFKTKITATNNSEFKSMTKNVSEFYLPNDDEYDIEIQTASYFPVTQHLNLVDANSQRILLKPELNDKNSPLLILPADKALALNVSRDSVNYLAKSISDWSNDKYYLIIVQNNITTDTVMSGDNILEIEVTNEKTGTNSKFYTNNRKKMWLPIVEQWVIDEKLGWEIEIIGGEDKSLYPKSGVYIILKP